MLPSWANETVIVRFPTWTTDLRNNPVRSFSPPASEVPVEGCSLQPGASAELLGGRVVTSQVWTLYLPAGTLIDETCQVEDADGILYDVDGLPGKWRVSAAAHVVAVLKAWR